MRDKIIIMEKGAYKTAKRPQVKKKKKERKKKEKKQRKSDRERTADFREKPIVIRWQYLWNPPLDHATFWICYSYHTPLLTTWRDWKEHNPLDRNYHRKVSGKQKGNTPAGQFGRQPFYLSSTVGSCSFLDMWCVQMFSSFWTVEIENSLFGKVLCMLNSSLSILR